MSLNFSNVVPKWRFSDDPWSLEEILGIEIPEDNPPDWPDVLGVSGEQIGEWIELKKIKPSRAYDILQEVQKKGQERIQQGKTIKDPFQYITKHLQQKGTFSLQERDLSVIQALIEHRFLTTSQIQRMFFGTGNLRYTQTRLKQLFQIGLTMKMRPMDDDPGSKETIHAATKTGKDLLLQVGRMDREEANSLFHTESENLVDFSYMLHDLQLNELCLKLFEEADRRKLSFEWLPTKLCRQQVKMEDGKFRVVEPDAVFIFYTQYGQRILHIEYERSADPRRFRQKLHRWNWYRRRQAWKQMFTAEPFILVIGDREGWETGGRKRRVVKSIQPLRDMAHQIQFKQIAFLPIDEIESETWSCLPYPDISHNLWDLLQLK